jgi:hypothetical protein
LDQRGFLFDSPKLDFNLSDYLKMCIY